MDQEDNMLGREDEGETHHKEAMKDTFNIDDNIVIGRMAVEDLEKPGGRDTNLVRQTRAEYDKRNLPRSLAKML